MQRTILTATAFALTTGLWAQSQVTGTVADDSGEALAGASIKIVGTTQGTMTDENGRFTLNMPVGKTLVQVSYIGYKTQVLNAKEQQLLSVILVEDDAVLEEAVVVGYGTMRKSDLTGSVAQMSSKDLMAGGTTDVAHGMQGKVAGVDVRQSDGAPGAGVSITVRGANSFTTSSQPLYIIDGVPYGTDPSGGMPSSSANEGSNTSVSPLSMINPNDIEKIDVLKDASATAIYGSRGANGVVIITTKKGKKGDGSHAKVEFSAKWSMQSPAKRMKMLDPHTFALYQNEAAANSRLYEGSGDTDPYQGKWEYPYIGGAFDYNHGKYNPSPDDFLCPGLRTDEYGNLDEVAGANWQDEIFQTGGTQDYSLNVSGGDDRGWWSFSGSYTGQTGIIRHTGYDRYGLSTNLDRKITPWLELGTGQFFTHSLTDFQRTGSENTGIIRSALIFPPTYGVHTATEQLDELNWLAANPVNYVNGAKDELRQLSYFSSSYAEITLAPWLKFRQNLGLGYNDGHRGTYYDRHTQEGKSPINGKAGKATNIWRSMTAESILTFDKTWNVHHLNVVGGVTFEGGWGENTAMSATNFASDITQDADMALALEKAVVQSGTTVQKLNSYLGRVNYTLLDKYLLTASVRCDGSSSFAKNNKWATFTSGAVAWRLSEEEWIRQLDIFSNLKLRVSYGETGNQGIGAYRTLGVLQAANYPYNGTLSSGMSTIDWRGKANPDLKWETTRQWNVGLDMGFMNNRLSFTLDYYYKKTRDLLQNISVPASTGFSQRLVNSGNVTNEGVELTVNYDVFRNGPVRWHLTANISANRNRIGGLDGDQYATSLWSAADHAFLQRNGKPIGTLYGYVEDGFFDNVAEVRSMRQYATLSDADALKMVGEIKYRDLNGDGYITEDDRAIIGDTNPDFVYSLTSNLSWRGLSLDFMLQGSQGNDILNYNLTDIKMSNIGNITREAYDHRWTPETAATALWPKATAGYTRTWLLSNRHVENGSYLRLKYVTLSYNWQKPFRGIQNLNFSLTANNVFTVTKYSWYDPDVNAGGANPATPGVDSYSYPTARTFTLGVNITL